MLGQARLPWVTLAVRSPTFPRSDSSRLFSFLDTTLRLSQSHHFLSYSCPLHSVSMQTQLCLVESFGRIRLSILLRYNWSEDFTTGRSGRAPAWMSAFGKSGYKEIAVVP